jgi:hypothetical protein
MHVMQPAIFHQVPWKGHSLPLRTETTVMHISPQLRGRGSVPKSYVDYDAIAYRIETDVYRLKFVNGFPADFALQAKPRSPRPNMIADFQILGETKLFGLVLLRLTNVDIQSRVIAFRAVPIRLIRQVAYWSNCR